MGFLGTLLSIVGFGLGLPVGLLVGYFLFIYFEPRDVKGPIIKPLSELDTQSLRSLLPYIPLWVKNPDYDRVDWMNKFLSAMWPFLDKAICNIIRSTARPIFDQYAGKFCIESIKFDHLKLGSLPPTLSGVKIYDTQEKDIVIETGIRWASNSDISVVVKCLSQKVSVQLTDLQIFIIPRVTLKPLVPAFPCFANISVSLMEKPYIDFGFKLFGGDIMAIPGLYRFIQDTIKKQVSDLYHWPEILDVPILDSSSGAAQRPVGILHVSIVRALNLQKMDLLGKSDPYVKLSLSGERLPSKKTTVQMCNLNPVWNERFKLIVKSPQTQVLELHVYDWEKIKAHDKLGMQVIPLSLLTPNETKEFTLDLLKNTNPNDPQNKRNRGKILVELRFDPFIEDSGSFSRSSTSEAANRSSSRMEPSDVSSGSGALMVRIERAEDVEGKRHNNPYAVIFFRGEHRKTKRIMNSRNPRWNEWFEFTVDEPPTDQKIHIAVMSRRRFIFLSKESLGHVDINLVDVVNNGRINEKHHLINSKNGVIHVELRWNTV